MRVAVIGIGSNSVRMLIADIENHIGHRVRRERAGTRLFAGLDAQRRLSPQSMKTSVDSVAAMATSALEAGAEETLLFATSATRDASNSDVFASLIRQTSGLELQILPGESEAQLSFFGASGKGQCGRDHYRKRCEPLLLLLLSDGRCAAQPSLPAPVLSGNDRCHRCLESDS